LVKKSLILYQIGILSGKQYEKREEHTGSLDSIA
jgi:hypothetical protein